MNSSGGVRHGQTNAVLVDVGRRSVNMIRVCNFDVTGAQNSPLRLGTRLVAPLSFPCLGARDPAFAAPAGMNKRRADASEDVGRIACLTPIPTGFHLIALRSPPA